MSHAYLPLSNIYSLYRRRFRCWLLNSTSLNKTFRFPCEKGQIWSSVLTLLGAIYLAIIKHILTYSMVVLSFSYQAAETPKFMHQQAQILHS